MAFDDVATCCRTSGMLANVGPVRALSITEIEKNYRVRANSGE